MVKKQTVGEVNLRSVEKYLLNELHILHHRHCHVDSEDGVIGACFHRPTHCLVLVHGPPHFFQKMFLSIKKIH